MKVPLSWLEKYIKLEHTPKEFGDIMTGLEFMQDGPIKDIENDKVIDLEIRQNRSDMLSIIGVAREYAAYLGKKVNYPEITQEFDTNWGTPKENLSVQSKNSVKRFCTVQIKNIHIKKSPEYIINALNAYGISTKNNLVDITNYVMLEYGIPLHAFDVKKLDKSKGHSLLTIRHAADEESFETWQKTKINLTTEDIVVADSKKPVAIAGIIGGANSDIDANTSEILLEAAVYDHATVRRTALRHGIRTEASLRHEKFLNPEMVEVAIRRATLLIQQLCSGVVVQIEDHYENNEPLKTIDFNVFEIERLGGIHLEKEEVIRLLENLEFKITDQKEALGVNKDIITVAIPDHRTDVKIQADLVEEVLRLKGYEHIPRTGISASPPDFSTPKVLLVEEKIRDILVNIGLSEHITNPLVKYTKEIKNQIQLENPLNAELDGLRTTIRETLLPVLSRNAKAGNLNIGIFEVGKIYMKVKQGEYNEERRIETVYATDKNLETLFKQKVKPDFIALINKLGINDDGLKYDAEENHLKYFYNKKLIANLFQSGFELITDEISEIVNLQNVPSTLIKSSLSQKIVEELSLVVSKNKALGEIIEIIKSEKELISQIEIVDLYEDAKLGLNKISITVKIIFEDAENKLTKESVGKLKEKIVNMLSKKGFKLRD